MLRPPAVCSDDRNAHCLPEAANSLLVHSEGIVNKYLFGRARATAPHLRAAVVGGRPSSSGVDHVFRVVVREYNLHRQWVARSRAACVGSPKTASPAVRFRLSPTIARQP